MHIETWLCTRQFAFTPHEPGQGSTHFSLMHANSLEQSVLIVHSGRQFGGLPVYCNKHEQDGDPPTSRH